MYFEWKDTYSVNVEKIVEQHKKLFEIGGRITDLVMVKDGFDHYDEIMDILQELTEYTIYHFNFEERLMEKYGYEGLDSHRIEHIFFMKKIEKVREKDIDSKQSEISIDLVAFVSDWITSHILTTDMKYRNYFNEKGAQ